MAISYVADNLITTLQLFPLMPSVQALFQPPDFLNILNFILMNKVIPLIDEQAEEHFVYNFDQPYNQAVLTYTIPYRAIGNKLRSVCFVDTSGQEVKIERLRPEEIQSRFDSRGQTLPPFLFGFTVIGNAIRFYFNSSTGALSYPTLRMKFTRQPNNLVLQAGAAQVSMITGNSVTVTNLPTGFVSAVTYDFIQNIPPFQSLGDDINCTNISGLTMTFASVPIGLSVGDWIGLSGQSPVPQIPVSAINYLLQESVAKCLEIHGDVQGLAIAKADANQLRDLLVAVLTPRVEGNPIKLTSTNTPYEAA